MTSTYLSPLYHVQALPSHRAGHSWISHGQAGDGGGGDGGLGAGFGFFGGVGLKRSVVSRTLSVNCMVEVDPCAV